MESYYEFFVWDWKGSGRYNILAKTEEEARKVLKGIIHKRMPFRKVQIKLERVYLVGRMVDNESR